MNLDILSITIILWPNSFSYGWKGFIGIGILGVVIALLRVSPKRTFSVNFSSPDTKITIKTGDLFDQDGHLVIGFNDVFDTEIGRIISGSSVQGQFLTRMYGNDTARLNQDLERALKNETFTIDPSKTVGKNRRYPIENIGAWHAN